MVYTEDIGMITQLTIWANTNFSDPLSVPLKCLHTIPVIQETRDEVISCCFASD